MQRRVRWGRAPASGPLVIGHRGASARELENTTAAFHRAARDGADGVELDVLCCATGEVVVFHDDDLQRLGGRADRIDAMPFTEVRAVRLEGGHTIPTLEEAFEACGRALLVNVELKSRGWSDRRLRALVAGTSRALDRVGATDRTLVSSFSPIAVGLWRRRRPDVPVGLLLERSAPGPLRRAVAIAALRPLAIHPEHTMCDAAAIGRWQARGHAVNTWTVDDPGRLRALRAAGVDGIITNDPAAARAALG